jgi:low temperature requirement protein LtrA
VSTELHHHSRAMRGRDPHQSHRVATPLELLFDLTFVIAYAARNAEDLRDADH